jgi:hypothetical protein
VNEFENLERYGYLLERIDAWEWGQAKKLAIWFTRHFKPCSVVDIGCASGLYLVPYLRLGVGRRMIYGIDGAPTAGSKLDVNNGQYGRFDLRYPFTMPEKRDLCYCLETAEHLEPQYADSFVASVATCSDTILFSAAKPGQGGEMHFNEQQFEYWLEKFGAYGFELHPLDGEFRDFVASNPQQVFHPWLINNGHILSKVS